jgi:hypothetical protein
MPQHSIILPCFFFTINCLFPIPRKPAKIANHYTQKIYKDLTFHVHLLIHCWYLSLAAQLIDKRARPSEKFIFCRQGVNIRQQSTNIFFF